MRWNLSEFEEIEPTVTETYDSGRTRLPRVRRSPTPVSVFRVGITAALASAAITLGIATGTSMQMTVPAAVVAATRAEVSERRLPLSGLFDDRFDENWTPAIEADLIRTVMEKYQGGGATIQDPVDAIHANQQEALSDGVPRLSHDQIRDVLRSRRKLA